MDSQTHLLLYFLLVLGIVLLPGMDMAFVLASALAGGRRTGLAAVGGIVAAGACHVAVGATGVAVVLQLVPALATALLWAGAAYLAFIGWSVLRSGAALTPATAARGGTAAAFRRGALTNLLNPKAYLFMLAVFPRFLRPERGDVWLQALVLWGITAATQTAVYGALALAGGGARGWLEARPAASLAVGRVVGVVLLLVAGATALQA